MGVPKVKRNELGDLKWGVTQIGFGSMGLRGPNTWGKRCVSDEAAEQLLNAVLDAGINLIDTAPDYGVCEERIGRYLGARRHEYLLATKCGCTPVQHADHLEIVHTWDADTIRRNVEQSLQRLHTDWIDILQFHGGDATTLQQQGLIEVVQGLKREGIVRAIGVSSRLPQLTDLIALNVFDTFQIPFNCLSPEHDAAMAQAAEKGAGIIIRGGIAHGGPDAEIERPQLNSVWEAARLDELLPEGVSRAELILRYTLTHPHSHCVIVGTSNLEHLHENLAAASRGPLPAGLFAEISQRVKSLASG